MVDMAYVVRHKMECVGIKKFVGAIVIIMTSEENDCDWP